MFNPYAMTIEQLRKAFCGLARELGRTTPGALAREISQSATHDLTPAGWVIAALGITRETLSVRRRTGRKVFQPGMFTGSDSRMVAEVVVDDAPFEAAITAVDRMLLSDEKLHTDGPSRPAKAKRLK